MINAETARRTANKNYPSIKYRIERNIGDAIESAASKRLPSVIINVDRQDLEKNLKIYLIIIDEVKEEGFDATLDVHDNTLYVRWL